MLKGFQEKGKLSIHNILLSLHLCNPNSLSCVNALLCAALLRDHIFVYMTLVSFLTDKDGQMQSLSGNSIFCLSFLFNVQPEASFTALFKYCFKDRTISILWAFLLCLSV